MLSTLYLRGVNSRLNLICVVDMNNKTLMKKLADMNNATLTGQLRYHIYSNNCGGGDILFFFLASVVCLSSVCLSQNLVRFVTRKLFEIFS